MFSKLAEALSIKKDATAEFTIVQARPEIVLVCRPATQVNSGYYNDALRDIDVELRRAKGQQTDAATLEASRDKDRVLFAKHVIVSWRNVFDDDGKEVAFGAVALKEFLEKIPPDIFDEVRVFCKEDDNFRAKRTGVANVAGN